MFGGIDPKKIQAAMKQMGISQEEIEASRVIIEKTDGGRLVINNPNVTKVKMNNQTSLQVSGDIEEETPEEESDEEKFEEDIKTIVEQTGVDKEIAAIELEKNNGDLAETIIQLTSKDKKAKKK